MKSVRLCPIAPLSLTLLLEGLELYSNVYPSLWPIKGFGGTFSPFAGVWSGIGGGLSALRQTMEAGGTCIPWAFRAFRQTTSAPRTRGGGLLPRWECESGFQPNAKVEQIKPQFSLVECEGNLQQPESIVSLFKEQVERCQPLEWSVW